MAHLYRLYLLEEKASGYTPIGDRTVRSSLNDSLNVIENAAQVAVSQRLGLLYPLPQTSSWTYARYPDCSF